MKPADIQAAEQALRPRGWLRPRVAWSQIARASSTRLTSLGDEVGLVLDCGDESFYVRETDPGFDALARHLGLAGRWGADWTLRCEAGEAFTLST